MINAAWLAQLHARCFTVPRPWSEKEFVAFEADRFMHWHIEEQGFLLGRSLAGETELLTLAVAPEARGQGYAEILMKAFHAEARERGSERIFLEVAVNNPAALALYAKHDYKHVATRRAYYAGSLDAHVMELHL